MGYLFKIRNGPAWKRACIIGLACMALFVLLSWLVVNIALWLAPPLDIDSLYGNNSSSTIFDRKGRVLRPYLAPDQRWRIPVENDEISTSVIEATLAVEDKRFRSHSGVDWVAALRSARMNLQAGHIVSGASTLTMQAAMFDQIKTGRTIGWKFRQIWRALRLEQQLSKNDILALYLSNAPYGGNIHGIEAAAQQYFGIPAKELDLSHAALLAGVPQSPTRLRPDRNLSATLIRRDRVLALMLQQKRISQAEYAKAKADIPEVSHNPLPRYAPHFTDYVHNLYPRVTRLRTTLDRDIQFYAEHALTSQLQKLKPRGVTNGSAIVLDNATADVLAMVGSIDYDAPDGGQVNGTLAIRSPGSTLKPFLYALAFETGQILPETTLYDVPMNWPGYSPENFARSYQGLVRADKALAWSLNIPAVEVLRRIGIPAAVTLLRNCGLNTITPPEKGDYGLSLAIGSCGVRLADLTNAYTALACRGEWKPWRVVNLSNPQNIGIKPIHSMPVQTGKILKKNILTPGAAYFTLRALSDPTIRSPEGVDPSLFGLSEVAWKTGTSSKNRDAWTVALDGQFTVGVWFGNFNSKPSKALVGAEAAAPTALSILRDLKKITSKPTGGPWPQAPVENLSKTVICATTGLPAQPCCPTTATASILIEQDKTTLILPPRCTIHRTVLTDTTTGWEVCDKCMGNRLCVNKVFPFWPLPIAAFLERRGIESRPKHNPDCPTVRKEDQLRILSPLPDAHYFEDPTRPAEMQKVELKAEAPPDSKRLWWFADDALISQGDINSAQWWIPTAGTFTLLVTDEAGRTANVKVTVERP